MNISKLIITPITSNCKGFVRKNPSKEVAKMLINERLDCGQNLYNANKVLNKLPAHLKNLVNPKCRVAKNI